MRRETTNRQIMTVLGPVDARTLGFTLTHEHFLLNIYWLTGNRNGYLYDTDLALDEIGYFRNAGGRTVVDLTVNGMQRSPEKLRWLAERSGVHIIMGCGWYRERFYDPSIWRRTTADLADELVSEIENGVGATGIRPGVIGEIGTDSAYIKPAEERIFRAAARAQRRSGLPFITHALDSDVGLSQLDLLEEEGVDPRRVVISHCATHPDPDYHEAIARRGAYVQFDIRGEHEYETQSELRQILEFIRRGYLEHLLLSHDVCFRTHLRAYGGNGYAYLISRFNGLLLEAGLSREQLEVLFVENPRRWLAGE